MLSMKDGRIKEKISYSKISLGAVVLFIALFTALFADSVFASPGIIKYSKKATVTCGGVKGVSSRAYVLDMGSKWNKKQEIILESSKPSVAEIEKQGDPKYPYISVIAKKAGTAKLTISVLESGKKKTYKMTVTVKKYSSPVKKYRIGSKNYAKKFKKWIQSQNTVFPKKKAKVSISAAKGWKLKSIIVYGSKKGQEDYVHKVIKNNSSFDFNKFSETDMITALFINKKTKVEEELWLSRY